MTNCIQCYLLYQQDKLPVPLNEELCWTNEGGTTFTGWSINTVEPFLWDEDGNHYLFVAMDPLPKWVETHAMPYYIFRKLLSYCIMMLLPTGGKPCYVRMDNGAKFTSSFA